MVLFFSAVLLDVEAKAMIKERQKKDNHNLSECSHNSRAKVPAQRTQSSIWSWHGTI